MKIKYSLFLIVLSVLLAVPIALLSPGAFRNGWLASGLLLTLSSLGLWLAWRWGGAGKKLALLIALAFLLRLGVGIGLSKAYQAWGYDEAVYHAGYLFPDAMNRDTEAYKVAVSDQRLFFNPNLQLSSDQYGGLGLTSALIYRYLSPDAHRSYLILILGAFFFALGVPFLLRGIELRWPARVATLAVWIYLLYPDGIFFTSSQMREPFMLGLSAIGFWAVLAWGQGRKVRRSALVGGLLAGLGLLLFSTRSALFIIGVLAFLILIEYILPRPEKIWKILAWTGLALGALFALAATWAWFREASGWDLLVTQRGSGVIETRIHEIGELFRIPFLMAVGLAQPVLPAAITETNAIPLAKTVIILRSLGWYAMAPLFLYALFCLARIRGEPERRRMIWAVVTVLIWACVASLRAGGDMTDNPRYRMLFLVLFALIAAWAIEWARQHQDAWLARWVGVEAVFLAFFTLWYAGRYYHFPYKPNFFLMLIAILGMSGLILGGGYFFDRRVKKIK